MNESKNAGTDSQYKMNSKPFVITGFENQAQAEAVFKSLTIRNLMRDSAEILYNPDTANKEFGWFVYQGELVALIHLDALTEDIEVISAHLYCMLKNI